MYCLDKGCHLLVGHTIATVSSGAGSKSSFVQTNKSCQNIWIFSAERLKKAISAIITQEFRFYYKKWTDIFMGRCHKPDSHNGQAEWKIVLSSCLSIMPVQFVNKSDRHNGLPKFDPKKLHGVPDRHDGQARWQYCFSSCLSIMTVRFVTSSYKNVCPLFIVKSEFLGYNGQYLGGPWNRLFDASNKDITWDEILFDIIITAQKRSTAQYCTGRELEKVCFYTVWENLGKVSAVPTTYRE